MKNFELFAEVLRILGAPHEIARSIIAALSSVASSPSELAIINAELPEPQNSNLLENLRGPNRRQFAKAWLRAFFDSTLSWPGITAEQREDYRNLCAGLERL